MKPLLFALVFGTSLFCAALFGARWIERESKQPRPVTQVAEVPRGPSCTIAYPRGFKITKRDLKAKPTCAPMDTSGILWDRCVRRVQV